MSMWMSMSLLVVGAPGTSPQGVQPHRSDWLWKAKWGVFCHYLCDAELSAEDWNARVDGFDTAALAEELRSVGAPYICLTIGQNSGHYCAPNARYDQIVGVTPSKCSERDLVADLYDALSPHGIRLMVYLPSGAPAADPVAQRKLKWRWGFEGEWPGAWNTTRTGDRLAEFQLMWQAVIREWSLRWGDKVCGWWFDGCYFSDEMYRHEKPPNFASFAAAARAGNPDSIVAFNPGVLYPVISLTPEEDYTAGEVGDVDKVDVPSRFVDGAQLQLLSYLGPTWGAGPPRYAAERAAQLTCSVVEPGGVVTWDVPIQPDGHIPGPFLEQLGAVGRALADIER